MIRINLVEGIKKPLPPATTLEIITVAGAALGFALGIGALAAGVVTLLTKIF